MGCDTTALEALMMRRALQAPADKPFERLPAVEGKMYCNICGGGRDKSGEDFLIAVGFGSAAVTANGALIVDEQEWIDGEFGEVEVTLSMIERVAKTRPDADWRISMFAPLSEQEYQRHGDNQWALVRQGDGFA